MIIDCQNNPGTARLYSVYDAATGRCLDAEHIFYADDQQSFYRRHLLNQSGQKYVWDRRTREPITIDTPARDAQYAEAAWEQVNRPIAIFKRHNETSDL